MVQKKLALNCGNNSDGYGKCFYGHRKRLMSNAEVCL